MRITYVLCGLSLAVAFATCSPVVKREAESEDLSPLNEVYVFEMEDDQAADGERSDRDKRKIGVVKLGVTNGIINFVFGKLDSFLDSKTRALTVLDESNKIKNAAFGIDNRQSATGQFISNLVAQKIQAATGSIGPVINSATTFLSGAKSGLSGAFISKLAPLSSISSGVAGGLSAGTAGSTGAGTSAGVTIEASKSVGSNLLGGILNSAIGVLPTLSQSSGGAASGSGTSSGSTTGTGAGAGINLGAFANLGGGLGR